MAGDKETKKKLNRTLEFISKLLNDNNIENWIISYGTLLGIIRENGCISNDNDVDIIVDKKYHDIIEKLLLKNKLVLQPGCKKGSCLTDIIKTKSNDKYGSIDIYMATIDEEGNFKDLWNNVLWTNCYVKNKKNY